MFSFVQSLDDGVWDAITETYPDFSTPRARRFLVRACVEGKWMGIEVEPGLVVGFEREDDAAYFLNAHNPRKEAPRAVQVVVQKGEVVAFWTAADASYFVRKGLAVALSEEEAYAKLHEGAVAMAESAVGDDDTEEGDDEMLKQKIENKAGPAASETKTEKPAPAPKAVAPKGGKKK